MKSLEKIIEKEEIIKDISFKWENEEIKQNWLRKNNKLLELGLVKEIRTAENDNLEAICNGKITKQKLHSLLEQAKRKSDNYAVEVINNELKTLAEFERMF